MASGLRRGGNGPPRRAGCAANAKGDRDVEGFFGGYHCRRNIALVGGYIILSNGPIPANADAKPSSLEIWAAGTALRATLPATRPRGPIQWRRATTI